MFAKIIQSLIAKTHEQSADFTLVDTVFPGLELRVRGTGGKTWVFRYRMNGGLQQRLKLGKFPGLTVAQARELLGHAEITMALRYAHLASGGLALAVKKIARSAANLEEAA